FQKLLLDIPHSNRTDSDILFQYTHHLPDTYQRAIITGKATTLQEAHALALSEEEIQRAISHRPGGVAITNNPVSGATGGNSNRTNNWRSWKSPRVNQARAEGGTVEEEVDSEGQGATGVNTVRTPSVAAVVNAARPPADSSSSHRGYRAR